MKLDKEIIEDIEKLIYGVKDVNPIRHINPDGADSYECPFCGAYEYMTWGREYISMRDLEHDEECIYLLANELTNVTF